MNQLTSNTILIEAIATLIQLLNWNTFTVLYDADDDIGKICKFLLNPQQTKCLHVWLICNFLLQFQQDIIFCFRDRYVLIHRITNASSNELM